MLAPTSLAGRRLVVVMPVVHERAEGLQAFQTMAQMLLFGIRQEHIEFRDNLAHSLYRDMRILRICHANRQKALRLRRRPSPPSYGALQSLPREWLADSWLTLFLISMRGEPSLNPMIPACGGLSQGVTPLSSRRR